MTRTIFRTSIAIPLTLLATTALAGPPPASGSDAGAGGLSLDCTINGRVEHFDLAPGALDQGLFSLTRGGVSYVIEDRTVQVSGGPDAGKWDCVTVAPGSVPTAASPETMARIVELEGALANAEAALHAAQGDRDAADLGRLAAEQARTAALSEIETLRARMAELTAENETLQLSAQEGAAAQERVAALGERLNTALASNAALNLQVEDLQAQVAGLQADLAAARAEPDEMSDSAATEDEAPAENDVPALVTDGAFTVDGFDPEVAQAALDASGLSTIAHDSLSAAVAEAAADPARIPEVVDRLNAALGR